MVLLALTLMPDPAHAQGMAAELLRGKGAAQAGASKSRGAEVSLDRVVAIVNGELVLESDVEAEKRFAAFQPLTEPQPVSRDKLIERLIDRTLILQQMALQPEPPITDAEVDAELTTLRASIPKCAAYHCETEAGWEKFVADQGFTMQELRDRWKMRMNVLRFIEERFRMGIRIEQSDIDEYYKTTLIPAYQKEKATPPPESAIADRIQEIVLQQRVDKLLDDWLTSLRAQGSVRILKPGEEAP
ncbi:MAG TPA: peptidylprolyl isomerase [Acidobacteriaceae bacterium]